MPPPDPNTVSVPARPSASRRLRLALRRFPIVSIFILVALLIFPAITADWLAPHDPILGSVPDRRQPPVFFGGDWEHPLGTDRIGRDILSRIMHGAKVSLSISLVGLSSRILGNRARPNGGYSSAAGSTLYHEARRHFAALPSILLGSCLQS